MTKGFSEEFPGCLGVFMECKCAHWILFSHSCVLQPGATGNLTEGGREVGELREGRGGCCWSIHQSGSECSVWACCEARRAGAELPKPLFIFPNLIISFSPLLLSVSITEDHLFPPPFLSVKAERLGGQLRISHL